MKKRNFKPFIVLAALAIPCFLFAAEIPGGEMQQAHDNIKYAYWAFFLGGLSAISLPLGSILGIVWKPSPKITAIFTAFGGGALLAALSIELVAPTVQMVVDSNHAGHVSVNPNHAVYNMTALIAGSIVGGIFFYILNEMLNSKGGYLRKVSTTISHFNHIRYNRYNIILHKLSRISFFRQIPKDHIQHLIQYLKVVHFRTGADIFQQGEIAGGMYIIEHGEIDLIKDDKLIKRIKTGDVIGELSMLKHLPSGFTAKVVSDVMAFEILNDDFDKIRNQVPEIEILANKYAEKEMNEISHFIEENGHENARDWSKHAVSELHHSTQLPSQQEIQHAAKQNNSAPMAIWLGIFLDGIPESFVIGAGFLMILLANLGGGDPTLTQVVPYTLIAGLFLSNFPEAMSSSIGMRNMGWKTLKILTLWLSLMVMTAVGALFGFYFSSAIPETLMIGVEGLAAGAMLTMIAQTMIPEAVHIGGHKVVGLATLAGYLSAVAFKIFE
jgi:CRP-like cAMP-binding protein